MGKSWKSHGTFVIIFPDTQGKLIEFILVKPLLFNFSLKFKFLTKKIMFQFHVENSEKTHSQIL